MSAVLFTYPHYETRVKDLSIYTPTYREALPLHKPVFFMRMERGRIGEPMWFADYNLAMKQGGRGTFDKYSKYYSRESVFMQTCFERQGCYAIRLASEDATYASLLLSCQVTTKLLTQYEKDEYGGYVKDEQGNKVPLLDPTTNQPIQQPGYSLKWLASEIAQDQNPKTIPVQTVDLAGGGKMQTFPIMAVKALYPGEYGNNLAFAMEYDVSTLDDAQVARLSSVMYNFFPKEKDYNEDTVSPIRTVVGEPKVQISMKPTAIDKNLNKDYAAAVIFHKSYWSKLKLMSELPYSIHVYSNYFQAISQAVLNVESGLNTSITDPFMLDIMTGKTSEGEMLDHVEIVQDPADDSIVTINKNFLMYLKGGSDGDISDEAIEELTRQYLKGEVYPEIIDSARYPFTHLYDTGVLLSTKTSMIEFLGIRDDVKVVLSTQDCSRVRMNSKEEDLSVGESLHSSALLQPESIIHGTECCRAEIYQQAGYLNDTTRYTGYLPLTLDILAKRCLFQSKTYLDGMPKGLPQSGVTMFDVASLNWTPYKAEHKQMAWDTGLNWVQYYDPKRVHYADMRTVYRYDTSVLSSAMFTDVIVYAKHIIRYNWSYHAGRELKFKVFAELAKETTLSDMLAMLNGTYGCAIRFYQTEEEANIGYIAHCECKIIGNPTSRIWITDILCYRDGYNLEAV